MDTIEGTARCFGDSVDTDMLAPGLYMKAPMAELAKHCLEALDEEFAASVKPGDVVIAGRGFGIGSSREQAAQALLHLGIRAVVARSFGGIFYRNAFNNGLMALQSAQAVELFETGDRVSLDPRTGCLTNLSRSRGCVCAPVPPNLLEIARAGGLVPYVKARLGEPRQESQNA